MTLKRILIIDDDPGITRGIKHNLEATGAYQVYHENHAVVAVQTARSLLPDLILLDTVMPGMHGREVAARLSQDPELSRTPIVFLTAKVSDEVSDEETGGSKAYVGGYDSLAKPVDLGALIQKINSYLTHINP